MRDRQPKHRQRRREVRRIERKKGTRAGKPVILVVCEGRETEPNYIYGLCDAHGINRANVTVVTGDEETDATRLVQKALRRFEQDRDFDAVFVVCDCAGESMAEARRLAAKPLRSASKQRLTIQLIVSRPCFEFWLLLHFEYLARQFQTTAEVVDVLRRHVTDYDKADRQIFGKVGFGLNQAVGRVRQLKAELAAVRADSPDTDMPALIEALYALRRTTPAATP